MPRSRPSSIAVRPPLGSTRLETLNSAGLNARRLATMLQKAAETIEAGMSATTEVYDKLGNHVASVPDWKARLKATQQVLDVAGVIPSRNAPPPAEKPAKDEPVPEWARPLVARTIDVKPSK